jgi:polar amino acid transport system permease protein
MSTDVAPRMAQTEIAEGPGARRLVRVATVTLTVGIVSIAVLLVGLPVILVVGGLTPYEALLDGFLSAATGSVLVWSMILGVVALVAGALTYARMPTKSSRERAIAGAVLGAQTIVLATILLFFRNMGDPEPFFRSFLNFEVLEGYGSTFWRSVMNTVILAFAGEAGGVVLGLALAVLLLSKRAVVRAPARVYINFFRGTPLIWQLSIFYFGLSFGLGINLGTFTSAIIVFILNTAAYASEVFRAGIQSIERGQIEAARSLGMSYPQAMRYAIVPQAFRRVIPPLMNEFVILIKDTSLVIVLGLLAVNYDLFTWAREGYSATANATPYVVAAAGYLMVTLPLIGAVNAVERRLRSGLVTVTS